MLYIKITLHDKCITLCAGPDITVPADMKIFSKFFYLVNRCVSNQNDLRFAKIFFMFDQICCKCFTMIAGGIKVNNHCRQCLIQLRSY